MLGHVKVDTTQIYTQVSIRRLKEAHDLAHSALLEWTRTGEALPEDVDEEADLLVDLNAESEEGD